MFRSVALSTVIMFWIGCSANQPESSISDTYPFSTCKRVEVLSYQNRREWDTVNWGNDNLIANGQVKVDSGKIKERIQLTPDQTQDLFDVLYNFSCGEDIDAHCYEPRHAIIFYDSTNRPFAFIEVCLDCFNNIESEGIDLNGFCADKASALAIVFSRVGIKYFGQVTP